MIASRAVLRTQARAFRQNSAVVRRNVRFASQDAQANASPAGRGFAGGVAGGVIGTALAGFALYKFTGIGQTVQTVQQAKGYTDAAISNLKVQFNEKTPSANEALDVLRSTANKYAAFIPGGRQFVDKAFEDIETVRKSHGEEVERIVQDAYGELRDASKKGLSLETASETWNVLSKYIGQLAALAGDAGQDILNNHPELKNKLGGSYDQLKQMGDKLGPEAKKQVDETYQEIRNVLNQGLQWDTVEKIQKLIQEKTEQIKKMGDSAWQQGLDQIQPMLNKNPQMKKLLDENSDMLKKGNMQEVVDNVSKAVKSGDTRSLEDYISKAKNQASEQLSSGNLDKWFAMVPGGDRIMPQLEKLKSIAEKQGPQAEKLAKETLDEIMSVFEKKKPQLEELYNQTEQETKRR